MKIYKFKDIVRNMVNLGELREWKGKLPKNIERVRCPALIFYDSEGSVSRCAITSSSINEVGLKEVSFLLKKLGIETTLKGYGNGKYYVLFIFRKGRFEMFKEKVGFTIKRKLNRIDETLNTGFFSKISIAN